MSLFKSFDPEHFDFPDTGNLIGYFDDNVPVRLPDRDREFQPLLVTGAGEDLTRWIAGQMARDSHRNNAVICLDPGGRYADAFVERLERADCRRVLWLDPEAAFRTGGRGAGRVIPLNPCDPFGLRNPFDAAMFRDRLMVALGPMPGETARVLDAALAAFGRSRCSGGDRAFTLPALLTFCLDAGYRRYILSGLHPALLRTLPETAAFERVAPVIAGKLRPVFAEPVWRATLGVETALGIPEKRQPAPIVIVTGAALTLSDLPSVLWRHALFAHLRHLLVRSEEMQSLHLYGFGSNALDDPGIEGLLTRRGDAGATVTLARDAYGRNNHRPRLSFEQEIAFEPDAGRMADEIYARTSDDFLFLQPKDRGGCFSLTLPPEPEDRIPHPAYPGIVRKYSQFRHGRALRYAILDVDRLITACDRGDAIYNALDLPPPLAWRAEIERENAAFPKPVIRRGPVNPDNPFLRCGAPIIRRNSFRPHSAAA